MTPVQEIMYANIMSWLKEFLIWFEFVRFCSLKEEDLSGESTVELRFVVFI